MVDFTVFKGSKSGAIQKSSSSKILGSDEVLIRITHSGLCGTDLHYRNQEIALGHEGAGVVEQVGPSVKLFETGNRVGWGYEHSSCGLCKYCETGRETFCADRRFYGEADLDQGSFGSHAIWKESFLFKIPDNIENQYAAPLMCGGATVFNAMRTIKGSDRVGIIGIGGLGHLAIQFAAKMGAAVVVFSGTDSKKAEATELGAGEFHAMKDVDSLEGKVEPIDHLIVTTSQLPNWDLYLPIMAPESTIYPLSVSAEKISIPAMTYVMKGLRVVGSLVAARQVHRDMLDFASRHNIKPIIQEFPMTEKGISEAFETLDSGKMRYRGVVVA